MRREGGGLKKSTSTSDVLVIAGPFQSGAWVILVKFLQVLEPLFEEIFVITGIPEKVTLDKKIRINNIRYVTRKNSALVKIFKHTALQVLMACKTFQVIFIRRGKLKAVIFFLGATFLLSILVAKFFRKKTIIVTTGSASRSIKEAFAVGPAFYPIVAVLEETGYLLSDRIICYSGNFIQEYGLKRYVNKISIAPEHFLDFTRFKIKKEFYKRKNLVGYIGRLSEEKGVINLVNAIPQILNQDPSLEFLIIGDGQLRDTLQKFIRRNNLDKKVKVLGWIPYESIPSYLNELKLLILPSYTEGLPNVVLEAMACGTIVLATPVGAIPAVVKDGETGFLMKENSPECIAENILRVISNPRLSEIVKAARKLVEEEYTFEAAVDRYKMILRDIECI
jgi:glycosyltransferase involved in cell wall biosynthesis